MPNPLQFRFAGMCCVNRVRELAKKVGFLLIGSPYSLYKVPKEYRYQTDPDLSS